MTPVDFYFVLPNGEPLANSTVNVRLTRSSHTAQVTGITMPRPIQIQTNAQGQGTLNLWPSEVPYFVEVTDTASEAQIFYRFLVPEVPEGSRVRLQDIVVNGQMSPVYYDEAALAVIHAAKAAAKASEIAAAASAAQATTVVDGIQASLDAAIAAGDAAVAAGNAAVASGVTAQANAQAAAASLASVQALAVTVETDADAASAAALAAEAARAAAVVAQTNAAGSANTAQTAAIAAGDSQVAAAAHKDAAQASATSASASAGTATTKATEASTSASNALGSANAASASAAAAAQSAIDAAQAAGGGVLSFNTRSGTVTLLSSDVTSALGFTPYNNSNPSNYLSLAGLLAVDGVGSGLDADLLDGQQGSYFLDLGNATGTLGAARLSGTYTISITGAAGSAAVLGTARTFTIGDTGKLFDGSSNVSWSLAEIGAQAVLVSGTNIKTVNGASLVGAGNVDVGGAVNGILKVNGAGGYSAAIAGTDYVLPSGSITGNAATATKLATPRSINGQAFDGTQDITIPVGDSGPFWGTPTRLTPANNGQTLSANAFYEVDSRTGPINVILPVLTQGQWMKFVDVGYALGTNNVTLGRNGQTIRNAALDLILDMNGDSFELLRTTDGVIEL